MCRNPMGSCPPHHVKSEEGSIKAKEYIENPYDLKGTCIIFFITMNAFIRIIYNSTIRQREKWLQ